MKLSVIINTFNEGARVEATCRDFLRAGADEIIVCADGTTDGSCDALPPKTLVVRNSIPQGCGKSKITATAVATGDVLMWVDAHQSVLVGDIRQMAASAMSDETIVCPGLKNIYYDEQWHPQVVSGSDRLFYPNDEAILPTHTNQYRFSRPPVSIMVGVGLCMSRRTFHRVGGWNNFVGRHGSQERGMALRAYMSRVPIVIDGEVVLGHEFYGETHPSRNKNTGQYRFNNIVPAMANMWHSFYTVTSEPAFRSYFEPWFGTLKHAKDGREILRRTEVLTDHAYYHRHCKQRPDAELFAMMESLLTTQPVAPDSGSAALEPAAVRLIGAYASGRCLELGTGTGRGTQMLLNAGMQVVSVDHLEQYTHHARTTISDARAVFVHCPRSPVTGFYDLSSVQGLFDCIVIDGPPGTVARRYGIREVLPLLSPGGMILVDDAKRDKQNIDRAQHDYNLSVEYLPTHRGLVKITR